MKIRTKLVSTIIIWSILALTFFSVFFINRQRVDEINRLQNKIKNTSLLLNQVNSSPLYDLDENKLKINLQSFITDPELVSITLKEYNGTIVIHYESPELEMGKQIKNRTIVVYNTQEIGQIETIYSTYYLDQKLKSDISQIFLFLSVLILGIALVSYLMIKKITKPISELTEIMDEVTREENFTIRANIKSQDELGLLCKDFNTMLDHIEENRRTIEKSESNLKKAQQIANLGNWEWDVEHDLFYMSEEMKQIFGIKNKAFKAAGIQDFLRSFIHPADIESVTEAGIDLERMPSGTYLEFRIIRKNDQNVRWISTSEPIKEMQNNHPVIFGTVQDITERKRTEEIIRENEHRKERTRQLEEEKKIAEIANKSKSAFIANMSHELRTPLNAVLGYSEVLAGNETNPRNRKYLESIRSSGNALLSLVNDILDLSKIESGKLELQNKAVSMPHIFKEIEAIFKGKAESKDIVFSLTVAPDVPESLLLDDTKFRQILINIIGNAIKFTEQGHVDVRCTSFENSSTFTTIDLIIEIEDTGLGIAPEDREKIFGTFEQASGQKTADYGGTGLGLAISKQMIELMGGEIRLKSEVGTGTTFILEFKNLESAVIHENDDKMNLIKPDSVAFKPANILIVEDIDYNRDLLKAFLRPYNFSVSFAENGVEAIEKANSEMPNVILMDYKMPKMDGMEATRKLKADPKTAHIPIIMVTASALEHQKASLKKAVDYFLTKPVTKSTLIQTLMNVLRHSILENEPLKTEKVTEMVLPPKDKLDLLYEYALDGDLEMVKKIIKQEIRSETMALFKGETLHLIEEFDDTGLIEFLESCKNRSING